MISMPFQILVLALALNLIRQSSWVPSFRNRSAGEVIRAVLSAAVGPAGWTLALAGLTIGVLRMINTWDYPTYLGLFVVAIFMSEALRRDRDWNAVIVRTVVLSGVVLLVGQILTAPYLRNYELFYTGFERAPFHTTAVHYLTILGPFLAVLAVYLGFQFSALRGRLSTGALGALGSASAVPPASAATATARLNVLTGPDRLVVAAGAFMAFVAVLLLLAGLPVVGIAGLGIGALAAVAVLRRPSGSMLFVFLMAATALALTAGVEVITLKGDIGRMNTVFKFYLQVWLMLSVASAVMLTLLARRAWGSSWLITGGRRLIAIGLVILLSLMLIYPYMGTPSKLQHRFTHFPLSLDGMEFMRTAKYEDNNRDLMLPDDYRAINWMLDNIPGSPVIVEALAPLYHWRSRVSIWTGLPTVLGWDWHQKQQRGDFGYMVDDRTKDVETIFRSESPEAVKPLLDKYDVQYVYVGGQERAFYPASGLDKFERMVGTSLRRVYQDGAVTIYQVVR
jgi:YYY domain-containing protein